MRTFYGLTLIEFIIVAFVLGILAAIAIPKYIHLSTATKPPAIANIAGTLSEANTENYSVRKENVTKGVPITNCNDVVKALPEEELPKGYTITSEKVAAGATVNCTLKGPNSTSAVFTATGIN